MTTKKSNTSLSLNLGELSYVSHVAVSFVAALSLMALFTLLRRRKGVGPDPSRVALCSGVLAWFCCASKELFDWVTGWGNPQVGDLVANTIGIALAVSIVVVLESIVEKGE